jgi:hypothetical protein
LHYVIYKDIDFNENYYLNLNKIKEINLILLLNLNLRLENPILNSLIKKNLNIKIFSIGCNINLFYYVKNIGNIKNFFLFLKGKHKLSIQFLLAKNSIIICNFNIIKYNFSLYYNINIIKKYIKNLIFNILNLYISNLSFFELGLNLFNLKQKYFSIFNNNNDLLLNYFIGFEKNPQLKILKNLLIKNKNLIFNIFQNHNFDDFIFNSDLIIPSTNFLEKSTNYINCLGFLKKNIYIYYPPKETRTD